MRQPLKDKTGRGMEENVHETTAQGQQPAEEWKETVRETTAHGQKGPGVNSDANSRLFFIFAVAVSLCYTYA